MKFTSDDFKRLQWAIAFLVAMLALASAAAWTANVYLKAADKAARDATAARRDIQSKLLRAREEEKELRAMIGGFQALRDKGYVGPERRLDWIETLNRIKVARKIFGMEYDLAPQRPIDAAVMPGGANAGGFELMASQMRLRLQLLHEGELIAFLSELRESVPALIQIRSCGIERIAAGTSDRARNAQLRANCTLEWITLKEGK